MSIFIYKKYFCCKQYSDRGSLRDLEIYLRKKMNNFIFSNRLPERDTVYRNSISGVSP